MAKKCLAKLLMNICFQSSRIIRTKFLFPMSVWLMDSLISN